MSLKTCPSVALTLAMSPFFQQPAITTARISCLLVQPSTFQVN
jgi:hypothetical protein